jgi:hypothetical protein
MRAVCIATLVAGLVACALPAQAQKLYKHVDANGVVTYTDVPDKVDDKSVHLKNTKRNGDRTEEANLNLKQIKSESDVVWQQEQVRRQREAQMRENVDRIRAENPRQN